MSYELSFRIKSMKIISETLFSFSFGYIIIIIVNAIKLYSMHLNSVTSFFLQLSVCVCVCALKMQLHIPTCTKTFQFLVDDYCEYGQRVKMLVHVGVCGNRNCFSGSISKSWFIRCQINQTFPQHIFRLLRHCKRSFFNLFAHINQYHDEATAAATALQSPLTYFSQTGSAYT